MAIPEGLIRPVSGSALRTSLSADINETATTIAVADASSYPSPAANQFVPVRLDIEGPNEEVIFYGAKVGNSLQNCVRGADGTIARTHSVGEIVEHTITALDLREANVHINTATASYVPHSQHVHKSVAQTITANHTVSGNTTVTGSTTHTGPFSAPAATVTNLTAPTISGNTAFTGDVTFKTSPTAPAKISSTTPTAGTSKIPMRSDAVQAIDAKAILRIMVPAGTIVPWAGAALPTEEGHDGEWMWADGSAVSATTYPRYSANVGITHGGTNASPRLPNLNGRVPVGADGAHGLGQTGGATTKTLSVTEMPNHTHVPNDPGHIHQSPDVNSFVTGTASSIGLVATATNQAAFQTNTVRPAQTGISLQSTGGGAGFNIEQPWLALKYMVKVH